VERRAAADFPNAHNLKHAGDGMHGNTNTNPHYKMLRADIFCSRYTLLRPSNQINLNKSNCCSSKIVRLTWTCVGPGDVWVYKHYWYYGIQVGLRHSPTQRNGFLASSISAPGMPSHPHLSMVAYDAEHHYTEHCVETARPQYASALYYSIT
jgi:hypothetical protein